jgi:S-ribosylhomocysteine lyase LuxS involved in autoinducer biosynthesis
VTVVFWDLDTDSEVPITNVTTDGVSFNAGVLGTQTFTSYTPTLATSTWDVAVVNVDLTVTCVATNKYYDPASNSFDITIRAHHTTLTAVVDDATPWGSDTGVTVVFWDTDTDSQVPIANVTSITYNPTGYSSQNPSGYSPTLTTSTWTVEVVSTGISVICVDTNKYYDSASNTFDITIRAHHTTLTAVVDDATPWGSDTGVTVVFWDTDTDSQVPIANVTSITYNPTGYSSQTPSGYSPTLTTSTWTVEVVSTSISVVCVDTNKYYDPALNSFNIIIREHFTSLTISANLLMPYGNDTPLTVIFWDLDTDLQVPIANVSNLAFAPSGHPVQNFGTYSLTLDTKSWNVGTTSITLTVTCIESNLYYKSATHNFQVTIRSLWTNLYHEPTDLNRAVCQCQRAWEPVRW